MDGLDAAPLSAAELLASAPLLGSDGKIINRPGYHRRDQIFLAAHDRDSAGPGSSRPKQDVDQALISILDSYLGDFPFADDASKCHALAAILTPLVRRLVRGRRPFSWLWRVRRERQDPADGGTVADNRRSPAEPTMLRSSEEEMTKTLLSVLLAAPPYVFFDNLNEADSATLAAVIASPDCRFAGRILGVRRERVEVPALACWLASGNNPKVSRELARRTVVIKLDANAGTARAT